MAPLGLLPFFQFYRGTPHQIAAIKQLEDSNRESMGAWMRDAGKFQACMDILTSIAIGPDDFTVADE